MNEQNECCINDYEKPIKTDWTCVRIRTKFIFKWRLFKDENIDIIRDIFIFFKE